ncbi:hypothetical protein ONZ45_g217 [Pleurotus djamor]|nr:hypothetical protein ONZ45_g217 [Pleurotus djamor]
MAPAKPSRTHPALRLQVLPDRFFVVKLDPGQPVPPCIVKNLTEDNGRFFSLTRTNEELSLVGEASASMPDYCKQNSGWMGIKITGPMDFGLTGILCDLTSPLKAASVPVFAMSTWNTDYILVPAEMITHATTALEKDGWLFVQGARKQARL